MTGGMIGTMITGQPGSWVYFVGGVIAYSNDVKREELGVAAELLDSVGAVSPEVAEAMAQGVRSRLGTSLAVPVTGISGPAADGTTTPAGLTYIAGAPERHGVSREFRFAGDRTVIRHRASTPALRMLNA